MNQDIFIDHYETLQVSPNADLETIERVFRMLAKRYHPDNEPTADADKFDLLVKAYRVLSDPKKRAGYDVKYEKARALQWKLFDEVSASEGVETDQRIQQGILSLLYIARRRDAVNPAMGIFEMERLLSCPEKHMEFHVWYLKEKGWVQRTDTGGFAITASGVDAVADNDLLLRKDRLLPGVEEFSKNGEQAKDLNTDGQALLKGNGDF
jgi:curved DNA-binding protein CbpA